MRLSSRTHRETDLVRLAVENVLVINRDGFKIPQAGASRKDDCAGGESLAASVDWLHFDGSCVDKASASVEQRDAVSPELPAHEHVVRCADMLKLIRDDASDARMIALDQDAQRRCICGNVLLSRDGRHSEENRYRYIAG